MSSRAPLATAFLALLFAGTAPAALASNHAFQGLWCGNGPLHEFTLKLAPVSLRDVDGTLTRKGRVRQLHATVDGNRLVSDSTKHGSLVATASGSELRIVGGEGPLSLLKGLTFRRANGTACS